MLGLLVSSRYGVAGNGETRTAAAPGWLRRLLNALFHRH